MVTFRGFTTKNRFRKFAAFDVDLIKIDLLNAFNIRQGEKPGNPEYGSSIWTFIFEPLNDAVVERIVEEAERVITSDPRLGVEDINVFTRDGGVLLEMSLLINSGATPLDLRLQFDESSRTVQLD
jgi:phage baseplate assembly protein W